MVFALTIKSLDILKNYPELSKYVKEFNGIYGFMYTIETDPIKLELQKQLETVLYDSSHSGASWGEMMRLLQSVFNGLITREEILQKIAEEEKSYKLWKEANKAKYEHINQMQASGITFEEELWELEKNYREKLHY